MILDLKISKEFSTIEINDADIPSWANYIGVDSDGTVVAYSEKPEMDKSGRFGYTTMNRKTNAKMLRMHACDHIGLYRPELYKIERKVIIRKRPITF